MRTNCSPTLSTVTYSGITQTRACTCICSCSVLGGETFYDQCLFFVSLNFFALMPCVTCVLCVDCIINSMLTANNSLKSEICVSDARKNAIYSFPGITQTFFRQDFQKLFDPRHEKTSILHMRKQRRRSALQISFADQLRAFVFRYIDSTIPLLSKSKISSL